MNNLHLVAAIAAVAALCPQIADASPDNLLPEDSEARAGLSPASVVYERVRPAVVRVFSREGRGSGFLVAPDRVVTAWHVVRSRASLSVEGADGQLVDAVLWSRDAKRDLAVLALEEPLRGEPLELAPDAPAVGTPVWHVGHPMAPATDPKEGLTKGLLAWSLTDGIVSQVGPTSVQSTAEVASGSSGGPLVNADGEVVGVVSLSMGPLGAAVRTEHVEDLLADEPQLPRGPTVALGGRYGLGYTLMPGQPTDQAHNLNFTVGLDLTVDRKLVVGVDYQIESMVGAGRKAGLRRTRMMVGGRVGPRFELPFDPKRPLTVALQPYFAAGVAVTRTGLKEDGAVEWDAWGASPYIGGGLRLDVGPAFFDVGVTVDPRAPASDARVMFGAGIRF